MPLIRGLLDRIVLVGGAIAGGTTPSFVAQYRQRVGGRLDQVLQDLAPFQAIADRYHGGSLEALVQHHLASTDPTFHAEGAAIQAMMDSAVRLREAYQALQGSLAEQLAYLAANADPEIVRATWEVYDPSFVVSLESLLAAGVIGVALWLTFMGLWSGTAAVASRLRG